MIATLPPAVSGGWQHSFSNDFVPSVDEVAKWECFGYFNQSPLRRHDVQHWLEAGSQLLVERNLTRVHGFPNRT